MSRYITVPELAIIERIIECHDMLACRNKRRYELLIDALICWRIEINGDWGFWSMPWYVGILKFCSCHDMLAYWIFALAMICRHTETLLMPWYVGILKLCSCHDMLAYWNTCDSRYHLVTWCANKLTYLRPETWDIKHASMNTKYAGRVIKHAGQDIKYAGILKSCSCHDMLAYWNTWDLRYKLKPWWYNSNFFS
jgi:hypothetical protein